VIVLDASVLIAHLDVSDAHHDRAFALLQGLADERFAASALTVAELLVGPARAGGSERAGAALRALGVETVPIGDAAPAALAGLRAATGLKLPDCCVLLAAEEVGGGLATFDDRLAAAARDRAVPVHERGGTVGGAG
jgi:predicted nucleic acid-binding protein